MHPGCVAVEPSAWEQRRQQIRLRLAAIQVRLDELRSRRGYAQAESGERLERLASAQRYATASEAAAGQALAASARAYRTAAEAHERAARQHDRSAAVGPGDQGEHERQAAGHRAAASADALQAENAQSRLPKRDDNDVPEADAD